MFKTIILSHKALEDKIVKNKYEVKSTCFRFGNRTKQTRFAVISWKGKEMCLCETLYLANKIKRLLNDDNN